MSGAALRPEKPSSYYSAGADVAGRVVHRCFCPVVETPRLVLRPLNVRDVEDIVSTIGDYEVSKMLARVPHPYTRDHAAAFVAFAQRNAVARRGIAFGVTLAGRVIGVVGLDAIRARNRIGYWFARRHWGRGYATEAVGAVAAYAFEVLGVRVLRAGVFVDNPASLRVLAKIGFRRIGMRTSLSLARNQRVDHVATVLTRARFWSYRA
jgi:RimJ/RimL family protein N-acetyltransferase